MTTATPSTPSSSASAVHKALELRRALAQHKQANPGARARDIAASLGVSEGELVACHCGEAGLRLRPDWPALIAALEPVGTVMALTRNDYAVIESVGRYDGVSLQGHMGVVHGGTIDLRLFLHAWKHAYALSEEGRDGPRRSVQIFDGAGLAVHKVYLRSDSTASAWERMLADLRHEDQSPGLDVSPPSAARPEKPDSAIDAAGFRAGWNELKSTHDFYGLLGRFSVTRPQALRLAAPEMAWKVAPDSARTLLESAGKSGMPIMIFVGNPGCLQIHTGAVKRIVATDGWINVLDPATNLHLREAGVVAAWIVRKPTTDGVVTALECYDKAGEQVVQFFGERKPGQPERDDWRAFCAGLPRLPG
jgi:putative hemin transport protein